ncbi:hypothetical protein cypCar_00036967 [Cyprinus carpio]|nr:hypothetical protein cypCar_00036967 [Cyprinus carpio]
MQWGKEQESDSAVLNTKHCSMLISWSTKGSLNLEHAVVALELEAQNVVVSVVALQVVGHRLQTVGHKIRTVVSVAAFPVTGLFLSSTTQAGDSELCFVKMSAGANRKMSTTATRRLKQDYLRIRKEPVPYICAEPLPSDILECDFHPDTWNPAWSVSTILTALLSFMVENIPTLGSIETSDFTKRELSAQSLTYNLKDRVFCELFPEVVEEIKVKQRTQKDLSVGIQPCWAPDLRPRDEDVGVLPHNGHVAR